MKRITLNVGLGLLLLACGGKAAPESTPAPEAAATGGEAVSEPAEEAAAEEQAAPSEPASGPAKLTVVAKVGRDTASANVKVMSEDGNVLAEGKAGQPLDVQSGDLLIEATITDPKAIIDLPTMTQSVTLEPGQEATENLSFARSLVRVTVTIKGKVNPTAVVSLTKDGKVVAKLVSGAPDYVSVSPGRYEAKVKSQRAEITVSDLTLNEGATHNIPLNVTL
ncbi:MAG: hypothetical protein QM778_38250 [Myxococcales bacterium]